MNDAFIKATIEEYNKTGSLLNEVLYNLCKEYFEHKLPKVIIAKTQLIGRTYAVALERQRDKGQINDDFYSVSVVNAFKNSELDKKLQALKKETEFTLNVLMNTLETHKYLESELSKITRYNSSGSKRLARSFCSKYLHFHLPNMFFIYDTRAKDALSILVKENQIKTCDTIVKYNDSVDHEYACFAHKCFYLLKHINEQIKAPISLRELDLLLLKVANDKLKEGKIITAA